MRRNAGVHAVGVAIVLGLWMVANLVAAPVQRETAYRAAKEELPGFFPGPWQPAAEITLHNLSGDIAAYAFIFSRAQTAVQGKAQEEPPAAFVAKARERLAAGGKTATGNEPPLYGNDIFASIVISADDTEPPVLRCFLGLPPHVVKESDALTLAGKTGGGDGWRVRHYLMLGLFDEAFSLETPSGSSALVVDMRTRAAAPLADVKARANAKRVAAPDPERARRCQEAWDRYRTGGQAPVSPAKATPPQPGARDKSVTDSSKNPPGQAGLQQP